MSKAYVPALLAALLLGGCDIIQTKSGSGPAAAIDQAGVEPARLRELARDDAVRAFYGARGWRPVWDAPLAARLEQAFASAERHAIDPKPYLALAREGEDAAAREVGLTRAALDYARALAGGAVDPRRLFEDYEIPIPRMDLVRGLAQAVASGNVPAWLDGLAPADAEYRALSDAYLEYRRRAQREPRADMVNDGGKIVVGGRDSRVSMIVESLRANGYLPAGSDAAPAAGGAVFTPAMAKAVAALQADYGINPDGVIGADTLEALNIGAVERARILAVNLERRRWLDRMPAETRVDVNTAAATLEYWRDGASVHRARVVVGQPGWETPQLLSPMTRLVANPPWTIPEKIAEEEIIPKGADYMARENISEKNGRLIQAPGPKSALGLVKFDMVNNHQIYLHDTPAKALFASTERHSSHGCARVENALDFARMIAADQNLSERFEQALAEGEEQPVNLARAIPVRLLYHTAYLDGGRILFRTDPYGWDDQLAAALGFGKQARRRVRSRVVDVGP